MQRWSAPAGRWVGARDFSAVPDVPNWKDIELTLVSGRPVAFHQALYDAYYVKRPEIPVEVAGRLMPGIDRGGVEAAKVAPPPPPAPAGAPQYRPQQERSLAAAAAPPATVAGAADQVEATDAATQVVFKYPRAVSVDNGRTLSIPIIDRQVPAQRLALGLALDDPQWGTNATQVIHDLFDWYHKLNGIDKLNRPNRSPAAVTPAPGLTNGDDASSGSLESIASTSDFGASQTSGSFSTGLINGSFSISDPADPQFGWTISGQGSVLGGRAVLNEDSRVTTRFSQTFVVPPRATSLSFTIESSTLMAGSGGPPDALEVALLNANTMASLVTPAGLPMAYTFWPTCRLRESPSTMGLSPGPLIWMTARS
jgi:hypothetical protein